MIHGRILGATPLYDSNTTTISSIECAGLPLALE
jgi:hypothetical protein